jgi:translation initiation factor 1
MSAKNKTHSGIIYSTNPDFKLHEHVTDKSETIPPAQQELRIMRDSKQRGGKTVTLITGFIGTENDITDLAKQLKAKCGTGGSVKDGIIIIQGDKRDFIFDFLLKAGFKIKKAGG